MLVRWVFLAMAKHPDIRALANAGDEDFLASRKQTAALFTRLIAEDCPSEMRAMVEADGPSSSVKVFENLGRVAMTELMGHPDVGVALSELERYTDHAKVDAVMRQR